MKAKNLTTKQIKLLLAVRPARKTLKQRLNKLLKVKKCQTKKRQTKKKLNKKKKNN